MTVPPLRLLEAHEAVPPVPPVPTVATVLVDVSDDRAQTPPMLPFEGCVRYR